MECHLPSKYITIKVNTGLGVAAVDMRGLKGLEVAAGCRIELKDGAWMVP